MLTQPRKFLLLVFVLGIWIITACSTDTTTTPPPVNSTPSGQLPDMPNKPQPQDTTFNGCPPEGSGGDSIQNRLKNRNDEGNYVPVNFDAIMSLTWPKTVERKERQNWSVEDAATISKYEGIPVVVEGYLAGGKESGAESTNCGQTSKDMVDWHVWFVKSTGDGRNVSIVVEPTPRSRANHHWALTQISAIVKNQDRVRISGWVFFDPEHPDQLALTRGTLWEIHPVMQIEVWQNNQWVALDNFVP
jgi:hypothetical protein